eukprot:748377-Hanusia_phi.AAC.2
MEEWMSNNGLTAWFERIAGERGSESLSVIDASVAGIMATKKSIWSQNTVLLSLNNSPPVLDPCSLVLFPVSHLLKPSSASSSILSQSKSACLKLLFPRPPLPPLFLPLCTAPFLAMCYIPQGEMGVTDGFLVERQECLEERLRPLVRLNTDEVEKELLVRQTARLSPLLLTMRTL